MELKDYIMVTVYDSKRDFFFCITCEDFNDLLDVSERFPRNIYQFGSIEVIKSEEIKIHK